MLKVNIHIKFFILNIQYIIKNNTIIMKFNNSSVNNSISRTLIQFNTNKTQLDNDKEIHLINKEINRGLSRIHPFAFGSRKK